ncbi:DNA replication inhibitor plutonium [Scaptodrosophila lebanonensis]|uniref:DNA replication inhibitor plutonium n=1 Tax=Drosophila lebanonensis TaxID=7225 RepID=A0A6J2UM69_DROLE|nr:DNA replication inhibitor plutonium [Scaptodrosophila lebanonensis]
MQAIYEMGEREFGKMNDCDAFSCVDQDDIVSLRIICTLVGNSRYNIEALDRFGNTPLLYACYLGRFECARTLLEFRANIYAINYFGQNALTLATYAGHFQLVVELLRYRTYQDFNLSSLIPAVCVAVMRQHYEIINFLTRLDSEGTMELQTVHGLGVKDMRHMVRKAKTQTQKQKRFC